jgi:hypothetical protein
MKKEDKGGMRSATMPKEKFEKKEGQLGHNCKLKYATEFGNPADLDKNNEGLANYAKKNKMKY